MKDSRSDKSMSAGNKIVLATALRHTLLNFNDGLRAKLRAAGFTDEEIDYITRPRDENDPNV